ncbi:MAG: molybdopterin biosynthesis protein MoeB [Deltaproteobacteria bacterium RIFCSPLOWO2_02_FULL_46_8]|nr:MAG: molybdopterin biosynthesis protein MoeB [Deltaproteobacteria bacterium RIFCSPLOWO2_02_FULL_46_8]
MHSFQDFLKSLKGKVPEITPEEAHRRADMDSKTVILDVREPEEWKEAHIPRAKHIPRGLLELKIENLIPDKTTPIICHCAGGTRSLLAAHSLNLLGYTNASSMAGGFKAWKEAGFPYETTSTLTDSERTRYGRHLNIPEVGEEGQLKLLKAKVLLIGAGGLGSPVAFYLAAAGVGTIGIVDFDVVDASNLQRQILHTTNRIGKLKVDSAKEALLALNPGIKIETHPVKLSSKNVEAIFKNYDIIVDGSDNFPTRYLVNDACVLLKKPNVHGSVLRFEGQVSVFWPGKGPCYRCLYPEPPPPELAPSCATAGVLGILPGVIGMLEAVETIKIILNKGETLVGRLLCYDALRTQFHELKLKQDPNCPYCAEGGKPIQNIKKGLYCDPS